MSPPPVNKKHCCSACRKILEAARLHDQEQERREELTNAVTREELDSTMRQIRLTRESTNPTPGLPDLNDIIVPTNDDRRLRLDEPTMSHHDVAEPSQLGVQAG